MILRPIRVELANCEYETHPEVERTAAYKGERWVWRDINGQSKDHSTRFEMPRTQCRSREHQLRQVQSPEKTTEGDFPTEREIYQRSDSKGYSLSHTLAKRTNVLAQTVY